ncbi:MAG: hypothetical protein WBY88_17440 [Desulfosarcina sp.]
MHRLVNVALIFGLIVLMIGCATETRLEPAPTVKMVDSDRAVSQVKGVRVTADPDAWRGLSAVVEHITPMQVTISNKSRASIRVRYDLFGLIGETGRRYAALPPHRIEGGARAPAATAPYPYDRLSGPTFRHRGFQFAPPYASLYPGWPITRRQEAFDPYYYDRYYNYWETVALPTREMLNEALVEGDIDPGGYVSGFIYFEPVDVIDESTVTFRFDVVDADSRTGLGVVAIPFLIER